MGSEWRDEVRQRVTLGEAMAAAGGSQRGRRWSPCPRCGEARTRGDDRGVVGVRIEGGRERGHCAACGMPCDPIDVARWACGGDRAPWGEVQAWCAARGWCSAAEGWTGAAPVRAPLPPPPPREYAPIGEAAEMWGRSLRVDADPGALAWVRDRVAREGDGDAEEVIARIVRCDLARVLPPGVRLARWARCHGYGWAEEGLHDGRGDHGEASRGVPVGWRLLMRAWRADGALTGLRARSLWTGARVPGHRKEVSPVGGLPSGSVYACSMGRAILSGRVGRPGELLHGVPWSGAVLVREGGPDWLLSAAAPAAVDGSAVAVLGVWSGAWSGEGGAALSRRLAQSGAVVAVATDPDEAGERYAAEIAGSLAMHGVQAVRVGGAA